MKTNQQDQIFQIINNLTNDDDYRQELWCHYLSGVSSAILSEKLDIIKQEAESYDRLQKLVYSTYKNPPSAELLDFLNNFSKFEQSIMFLLLIGLSVDEVSKYKDISSIRIRQIVTVIRNNPIWENNKWHSSAILQIKKDTD